MKLGAKLLLFGGAVTAISLAGGKKAGAVTLVGFAGPTSAVLPIRIPPGTQGQPPTDDGSDRDDDVGRAWGTFYVNRDAKKHHELRVMRVAADLSNAAIGTGEVIADVYETIVASAGWDWTGQACGVKRYRLRFSLGRLVRTELVNAFSVDKPQPFCQTVRPFHEVYLRKIAFVQRGPEVFLSLDTGSGINMRTDHGLVDHTIKGSGYNSAWDNDEVASGYVVVDVSWIFTPT